MNEQLRGQVPVGFHQSTKRLSPPNWVTIAGRGRPLCCLRMPLTRTPGPMIRLSVSAIA